MEHNVSEKNLKEIISELLRLGYEGTYWDFKEDYTDCREDKLIDIICMANNIDGHQAYLIYGADDNGNVKGIEKTKYVNDKQITDHYAIIPTGQGFNALNSVNQTAARVYEVIVRRFLCIFYPSAEYLKITKD